MSEPRSGDARARLVDERSRWWWRPGRRGWVIGALWAWIARPSTGSWR
ncbi:hypothetical protein I553_4017 [Mycobacterium xenopi 4042]|uniref:Uncharacterized protein n=1 Tax=Mycobacterium xenopi 4042 TaxID=1299334 RepID=X8BBE3_MYCXE|nr:hypothetical protein I553_4017 [Mycobacterium xenopi 4042]